MSKVKIIAEIGVNHNGSFEIAKKMIEVAKDCGVDCVKFQIIKPELCISKYARKADYQKENTKKNESQLEMCKTFELPFEYFLRLKKICEHLQIEFLATPFDSESIDYLQSINVDCFKIPSGEITNYPYLVKIANTKKPVIMSTGMSNINEIKDAIKVLKENGTTEITLLQCNTQYPTPYEDVNLKAMSTLHKQIGCEVGYSDHTQGIEVPIAAVSLGATVIEKHFTLDKNMEGPDHKASLEPHELKAMVSAIRNIEMALGIEEKKVSESERENIVIVRKSIVASKKIKKGEKFTCDNITTKRPGDGINPMKWNEVIETIAKRDFEEDELIEL